MNSAYFLITSPYRLKYLKENGSNNFFLEILDVQGIFLWYIQFIMAKDNYIWSGFVEYYSENLRLLFLGIFYLED